MANVLKTRHCMYLGTNIKLKQQSQRRKRWREFKKHTLTQKTTTTAGNYDYDLDRQQQTPIIFYRELIEPITLLMLWWCAWRYRLLALRVAERHPSSWYICARRHHSLNLSPMVQGREAQHAVSVVRKRQNRRGPDKKGNMSLSPPYGVILASSRLPPSISFYL